MLWAFGSTNCRSRPTRFFVLLNSNPKEKLRASDPKVSQPFRIPSPSSYRRPGRAATATPLKVLTGLVFRLPREKFLPQKYDAPALVRASRAEDGGGSGAHPRRRRAGRDADRRRHGSAAEHEAAPDGAEASRIPEKYSFVDRQDRLRRRPHAGRRPDADRGAGGSADPGRAAAGGEPRRGRASPRDREAQPPTPPANTLEILKRRRRKRPRP